jgi:hypothetical protein
MIMFGLFSDGTGASRVNASLFAGPCLGPRERKANPIGSKYGIQGRVRSMSTSTK